MQLDLFTSQPLDAIAIQRIQSFAPTPYIYYGGFSGGIDSQCIYDLAKRSNIIVEWHYNQSPIDPPIVPRFIRDNYPDVEIDNHAKGFFGTLFMQNGLPLRTQRWCCGVIKEVGGAGRVKLLGMRREESNGRHIYDYRMDNHNGGSWVLPILDWTNADRWQYLSERGIIPNPLYKLGFTRTGCVLCPFQSKYDRMLSLQHFPKIVNLWKMAADRYIRMRWETPSRKNPTFKTGEEYFNWWITRK